MATARLLDIGTGPGFLAIDFAPYVKEVVGIDPEPAMLDEAAANALSAGVAVNFIEATAESLNASFSEPSAWSRSGVPSTGWTGRTFFAASTP